MIFNIIPAKPTFGNLKPTIYSSDYLQKKKNKLNVCNRNRLMNSYENRYSLLAGKDISMCSNPFFNKSNLSANLVSNQNLRDVCSLSKTDNITEITDCQKPYISVSTTDPFYQQYRIDPVGELFGNSQCGVNNFTHYMDFIKGNPKNMM